MRRRNFNNAVYSLLTPKLPNWRHLVKSTLQSSMSKIQFCWSKFSLFKFFGAKKAIQMINRRRNTFRRVKVFCEDQTDVNLLSLTDLQAAYLKVT